MISKKGEKRPQLPSGEPLIVVDLNSRKIDTAKQLALPQFHNMQADICAETIYFIMDRYFDGQDLAHFESVSGYNPANPPTEAQNEILSRNILISVYFINAAQNYFLSYIAHASGDNANMYNIAFTADAIINKDGEIIDFTPNEDGDHLVIKWALSSDATTAAGTLQFSIAFSRIDILANKVLYKLNTAPAKMPISTTISAGELEGYELASEYQILLSKISSAINLSDYYTIAQIKEQYYNKAEIDSQFKNYYDKNNIDSKFESYYDKDSIDSKFENYYDKNNIDAQFENYYDKAEINSKFDTFQVILDDTVTPDSENGVTSKGIYDAISKMQAKVKELQYHPTLGTMELIYEDDTTIAYDITYDIDGNITDIIRKEDN